MTTLADRRSLPPLRHWRKREGVLAFAALSLALFAAYGGDVPDDSVLHVQSMLERPMPRATAFEEPHKLLRLTPPVPCERLEGVQNMGREWIRQWGDGDLPPVVPICVNARR